MASVVRSVSTGPLRPFVPGGRAALRPLSRAQLLAIIASYGLNPAGKGLAWLTHAQLVTFIATAVEAQLLRRS